MGSINGFSRLFAKKLGYSACIRTLLVSKYPRAATKWSSFDLPNVRFPTAPLCTFHSGLNEIRNNVNSLELKDCHFNCGFSVSIFTRKASNRVTKDSELSLDDVKFENISEETLDSLAEHFEELIADQTSDISDLDVTLTSGVLTINLGTFGTYVINKQTPNKQIWLSSPVSGPKRFDFVNNVWIYRHNGQCLHDLLTKEISDTLKTRADFTDCKYGK